MLFYLKEWSKLKYKKIIITACVVTTVIITAVSFDFNSILMKLAGHSMKNDEQASTSHSSHNSDDKNSILNNLEISNKPSAILSTDDIPIINTPPKKKEPELKNVTFIDYVVNPADTLWRITRNYMPNFPAQDTEDTIGIITYIAEQNNLPKGSDGNYVIYYGQKLKIPAQKNIVSNAIKSSNKTVATASNKKVSTSTSTKNTYNSTSTNSSSTITSTPTASSTNDTLPTSQTEHSEHSSH